MQPFQVYGPRRTAMRDHITVPTLNVGGSLAAKLRHVLSCAEKQKWDVIVLQEVGVVDASMQSMLSTASRCGFDLVMGDPTAGEVKGKRHCAILSAVPARRIRRSSQDPRVLAISIYRGGSEPVVLADVCGHACHRRIHYHGQLQHAARGGIRCLDHRQRLYEMLGRGLQHRQ